MRPPSRLGTAAATRYSIATCCRAPNRQRPFSSSQLSSSPAAAASTQPPQPPAPPRPLASPPPPPPSGYASLSSRRLLSVSGPDAAKFLQGVITASIASPDGAARPRESGLYAAFLTAQGRVLFDVFIYPDALGLGKQKKNAAGASEPPQPGTAFLIDVDAAQAQALARHIRRYKLRAKLDVRLVDDGEATVWQVWNDEAEAESDANNANANVNADGVGSVPAGAETLFLTRDPRAPGMGHRLLKLGGDDAPPPPHVPGLLLPRGGSLEHSTEDAYTVRRYLRGVAEGQAEVLPDQALPQESNLDHTNGIDYHKGCYVGQELTIRTKHRGVVRKRILPCVVYGDGDGDAGGETIPTELVYRPLSQHQPSDAAGAMQAQDIPGEAKIEAVGKRARNPGKWLRGVGNVGLALCRLETMTDFAGPLPTSSFKETDEFKIEWANEGEGEGEGAQKRSVKVKAFVPNWLRAAIDETTAGQQQQQQ